MALNMETVAKLPTSQKLLALGGVVILIVLGYYFGLDTGYKQEIAKKDTELTNLRTEISKLQAVASRKAVMERELALLEKKLSEALTKLPNAAEVEKLLITMDELGRENGLSFSSFKPGKERPQQLYTEVPIALKFTGNFFHILRFFDEIIRLPRIVTISDLTMTARGGKSSAGSLDVSCTATTYKFREESATDTGKTKKGRRGK